MAEYYPKNEKFLKAREFVMKHPQLSKKMVNWRKMKRDTLYKALSLYEVWWSVSQRSWNWTKTEGDKAEVKVKQVPTRTVSDQSSVLVRIMADRHVIAQATNELLELARASNLTVLSVSEPVNNRNGEYQRIYVKLHFHRDARK